MTQQKNSLLALMIGAIGIVYGDIGTSPLYALKSCFILTGLPVSEANVLGLISLFIWLLILIVNLKYILIVMRCDQQGEGGVLVLSSLCSKLGITAFKKPIFILGVIAMALFVGDSVITPAISVLSALEGLKLVINIPENLIICGSIIILMGLFYLQSKGSGVIGQYFGYIMVIWFLVIGLLGLAAIINAPEILIALNPYYAFKFLYSNGIIGFVSLGGAILVITGVEALYADMGHFGKEAINRSWFMLVFPALALNYLGQGSLLLSNVKAIENPFYLLAPENLIVPLVILSVMATIIASQAVISGLFSLSWQAIMLHYLPRMKVIHTSIKQIGQIYVPVVNYMLCALTIIAVLIFRDSDSLASAYGLSVASVMLISTIFASILAYRQWKWSIIQTCSVFLPLLFLDLTFTITNLVKIFEGAWYTLVIASIVSYIIFVWSKGNKALKGYKIQHKENLTQYLQEYSVRYKTRLPGSAIFMSRNFDRIPYALEIQLRHNTYLHKKMLFVAIVTEDVPKIALAEKFSSTEILPNIFSIKARFGFYEEPNLHKIINWLEEAKILRSKEDLSFFLSRGTPMEAEHGVLSGFSKKLYIFLAKNSLPAYEFYQINQHSVVELGVRYRV